MTEQTLPHAPYIEAVQAALLAAGLKPNIVDIRDSETSPYDSDGMTTMLDAVITFPGADGTSGLALVWEHPADQWQGMPVDDQSRGECEPYFIPTLPLYATPSAVASTVQHLLNTNTWKPTGLPVDRCSEWDQAVLARAAVTAWALKNSDE